MNAPALPKVRMNVDEFLAWSKRQLDDRYELVDGEIIAMTRDTVRHKRTRSAVWRTLDDAVRSAGLPCAVFVDGLGVAINDKTLRIPDVLVRCGTEPDPNALIIESPLIVVEVVSPSSEPRMAETSASMWPRQRKSIACRWAKPGARILHLYGLLVPSETR